MSDDQVNQLRALIPSTTIIVAVRDWATAKRGSRRPPETTAMLLALRVVLHALNLPMPSRLTFNKALGMSVWSFDSAIKAAEFRGEITFVSRTIPTDSQRSSRTWVKQERYYKPAKL
jgi:hypothetical protein